MIPARDWRCPFTGRRADEWHHLSGRGIDGAYLDVGLVIPLCRPEHVIEHQTWRVAGVDDGSDANPGPLRLRRTGLLLVRLGERHGDGRVVLPALTVRELGLAWNRLADSFEGEQ